MRALSARQAATCEKAHTTRCRCRCHGAFHGAERAGAGADANAPDTRDDDPVIDDAEQLLLFQYLRQLPAEDPHHVVSKDGVLSA